MIKKNKKKIRRVPKKYKKRYGQYSRVIGFRCPDENLKMLNDLESFYKGMNTSQVLVMAVSELHKKIAMLNNMEVVQEF